MKNFFSFLLGFLPDFLKSKDSAIAAFKSFKSGIFRRRFFGVFVLGSIGLGLLWLLDPTNPYSRDAITEGGGFIVTLSQIMRIFLYLAIFHFTRKIIFDYINMKHIYDKAMNDASATPAALYAIAIGLFAVAASVVIAVATFS